jgi:hypothetical protein
LLSLSLPAFACSVSVVDDESTDTTGAVDTGTTSADTTDTTDTGTTDTTDTTDTTGDGDGDGDGDGTWGGWDTDGTPEATWCYDAEGPHPQFAFELAAGMHNVRTPADCAGWFVPGSTYELTVDEVTGTLSITNEFMTTLSHTWDDVADESCTNSPDGVDLTVADDAMNGIEVLTDGAGAIDRVFVWTGSASGCTLVPA